MRAKVEPHAFRRLLSHQMLHALFHLPRRFVGKRERQYLIGLRAARRDEVRDAMRQRAGFARTGSGYDQNRPVHGRHGRLLDFVESLQNIAGFRRTG